MNSVLLIGMLFLAAAAFPETIRGAVSAVKTSIDNFLDTITDLLTRALRVIWGLVKPVGPVDGPRTALGIVVLLFSVGLVVANYAVLLPTMEILMPVGHGGEFLAAAIVGLGCAVGILWHAAKSGRFMYLIAALSIVCAVGYLSYLRTMAITDGDLLFSGFAALIALVLQCFEILAVGGGLGLAGAIVPVLLALPILTMLGTAWLAARLLRVINIHGMFAALIQAGDEVLAMGLVAFRASLAKLRKESRLQRRAGIQELEFAAATRLAHRKEDLDILRNAEAARRREAETDHQTELAHGRRIRDEKRVAEFAMHAEINRSLFPAGAAETVSVMDETAEARKAAAKGELVQSQAQISQQIADATRAVFRHVGGFGDSKYLIN